MNSNGTPVNKPLPCIVCGVHPDQAFHDGTLPDDTSWVPYAATMFSAGSGHYGSTVWDEMSNYRSLSINVCDECLVARKGRVAVVERHPKPDKVEFVTWEGPWTGHEEARDV